LVTSSLVARRAASLDADWREDAACRAEEPELFFPSGATPVALATAEAAKAICLVCSVRESCLTYALETKQEAGIWGGLTEDERRRVRRAWLATRRRRAG